MPDGATHHKIHQKGLPLAILASVGSFYLFRDYAPPVGLMVGYLMGRWIDPDLDQMGTTQAEGRMVNELPVVGVFFYGWWSIYGSIFRRHHRSFITHFPGVSTFVRMLWGFWWVALLPYFGLVTGGWATSLLLLMVGVFLGQTLADALHWAADVITGELKKRV